MTKNLPHSLEAEQAVLGLIIFDSKTFDQAGQMLKVHDFYSTTHQRIFESMIRLSVQDVAIDLVTLSEDLEVLNLLDKIGGRSYLADLSTAVASPTMIGHYCKIVAEKSAYRKLIALSGRINLACQTQEAELPDLLSEIEGQIFSMSNQAQNGQPVSAQDGLSELMTELDRRQTAPDGFVGLQTGFYDLDQLTSGFQKSDMIVIAGRPSMGKTSLALSIILNMALDKNHCVALFSLETSKRQVLMRMVSMLSHLPFQRLNRGKFSKEESDTFNSAVARLANSRIYIDDTSGLSVFALKSKARQLQRRHKIEILVIDYMGLMHASGRFDNQERELAHISAGVKATAKDLDIPVIVLHQLSRNPEHRADKRPELADLRGSGAIEQDADLVFMVHRPEFYRIKEFEDGSPTTGMAEIRLLKHRNGPTGDRKLLFLKESTLFQNFAKDEPAQEDFS